MSASPAPQVAAGRDTVLESFHPDIRRVTERLFRDGHTGAAVFEAFKAVNNRVKRLTGLADDGKSLMGRAFDEQRPLLRINAGGNRVERNDEQEGFKFIFMGAMLWDSKSKGA